MAMASTELDTIYKALSKTLKDKSNILNDKINKFTEVMSVNKQFFGELITARVELIRAEIRDGVINDHTALAVFDSFVREICSITKMTMQVILL